MKQVILIYLLVLPLSAFAQRQGAFWQIKNHMVVWFEPKTNRPILLRTDSNLHLIEPNSSLAAAGGKPLLRADDKSLWNCSGNRLTEAVFQYGTPSCTQGALLLSSEPYADSAYLLMNNGGLIMFYFNPNATSPLLGWQGNHPRTDYFPPGVLHISEKMIAIRHANGRDWWVINHFLETNKFCIFRLANGTAYGPDTPATGTKYYWPYPIQMGGNIGQMAYDTANSVIASAIPGFGIELYDFDRCNGNVSFKKRIRHFADTTTADGEEHYGICFSPSGRYLYESLRRLHNPDTSLLLQYDLQDVNPMASRKQIDAIQGKHPYTVQTGTSIPFFGQQQLGLDGKIYIQIAAMDYWPLAADWPQWRSAIARIPHPDLPWPQCGYESHAIRGYDTTNATASLPNLPNYGLGPLVGSGCDTLPPAAWHPNPADTALWHPNPADTLPMAWAFAVPEAEIRKTTEATLGYPIPNPTNGESSISYSIPTGQTASFSITDMCGRFISSVQLQSAGTCQIPVLEAGLYKLSLQGKSESLNRTLMIIK